MANKMPLGVYAGNPNGNDASAEASFDNTVNNISSIIGQSPQFIDTFADFSGSWSNMVSSAGWNAWSQSKSPTAHGLTPVVAVGLGTKSDHGSGTLQQIASGAHDDTYRGIAEAYRDAGYSTIDMRIGWEMNGDYMPWSMGNTSESVGQWRAAFAHVADVVHSVSGIKVNTVWNPNVGNNNKIDVRESYAGDDKVDIIGLDIYSPAYKYDSSVSNSQYYNNPSASQYHPNGEDPAQWGLAQTIAMAKAHGKPVGIGETGVGVGDNTDLPGTIADAFSASGAPSLAFVNVWDVTTGEGDWHFTDGHNTAAGKAWAAAFGGGGSSNAPAPASTATNVPDSVPASATESAPASVAVATPASTDTTASVSVTSQDLGTYNGSVIFLSPNGNRAEAAWGPMDVAGDAGPDTYVVHPGDSQLTVENFSAGKGDVLDMSQSLQSAFAQTQVSGGTVLSFAGDSSNTGNVFLKGVDSIDTSKIAWN